MTLVIDDQLNDQVNGSPFTARGSLGMPSGVAGPNGVTPGYLGGAAVSFNTGAATLQVLEATSASSTTKWIDIICKLSAAATATGNVLTSRGGADVGRIGLTSTNVMRLFNGGGTPLGTGGVQVPVSAWFRLCLGIVGNTATAKLYTDPTSATAAETLTGTVTGAAMTLNRLGNVSPANLNGGTLIIDSVRVSNDAEPGPPSTTLTLSGSASASSVPTGTPVTVTLAAAGGSGTYSYEITNWGDGATSAPQSSPVFTHTYSSVLAPTNIAAKVTG